MFVFENLFRRCDAGAAAVRMECNSMPVGSPQSGALIHDNWISEVENALVLQNVGHSVIDDNVLQV